jgi:Ca2+-binding EF-hand superfamily protein
MSLRSLAPLLLLGVLVTDGSSAADSHDGTKVAPVAQAGGKTKTPHPSSRQKRAQQRSSSGKKASKSAPSTEASSDAGGATGGLLAPSRAPASGTPEGSADSTGPAKGRALLPTYHQASDEEITDWFHVADYDGNGWISYGEAAPSLAFDRARFGVYDNDHDGRLQFPEFKLFYFDCLSRQGTFFEPKPRPEPPHPPTRDPEQLRNAYDADLDEFVSQFELEEILRDYQRADLVAEQVLAAEDGDSDGRLSITELEGLVSLLYPVNVADEQLRTEQQDPAGSLLELFRRVVPRYSVRTGTPSPPLITGPVTLFSRLDLDDDGAVSLEDLKNLLRPVPERVRLSSVLNSLDLDGDGVLNPEELARALVPRAGR